MLVYVGASYFAGADYAAFAPLVRARYKNTPKGREKMRLRVSPWWFVAVMVGSVLIWARISYLADVAGAVLFCVGFLGLVFGEAVSLRRKQRGGRDVKTN